jgi:DNA polymerase
VPRVAKLTHSAADYLPQERALPILKEAAEGCRGCDLYLRATQTVFGEGPADAEIFLLGEQPGDSEDHEGRPFTGPAGRLLTHCLEEAGIARSRVYLTNVVKHFKWEPRGKRRIHEKPRGSEIMACRPWLDAELEAVRPRLIVCLGSTAAQALFGRNYRVTAHRGEISELPGLPPILTTVHPSAILRITGDHDRRHETERFIQDLRQASNLAIANQAA